MDEKRLGASFCPSRGQIRWFLTVLVAFAALVRLMVAYITVHYFDLSFYVDWSTGVANDFFGAYNNIGNLDYPPLFLLPPLPDGEAARDRRGARLRPLYDARPQRVAGAVRPRVHPAPLPRAAAGGAARGAGRRRDLGGQSRRDPQLLLLGADGQHHDFFGGARLPAARGGKARSGRAPSWRWPA